MRKIRTNSLEDVADPRPPRSRAPWVVALGLLASPLIYDGTRICAARWQALFGPAPPVETPAVEALAAAFAAIDQAIRGQASAAFRDVPWSPSQVLALAAVWVVIGARMLMRRR